jgi:hypothetical protein
MRSPSRSLLPGALALSAALAACSETTTEPRAAVASPAVPAAAIIHNSWLTLANMPSARTELATATVTNAAGQSIVYAIGGFNPNGVPLDKVTAYNVATNTWTFRRPLPRPLAQSNGAGVINGRIYVSGGFNDNTPFPSWSLYMYDPATNTWTQKRDMPGLIPNPEGSSSVVGARGVTGVINGKLYVVSACFGAWEPWGYFENQCSDLIGPRFFRYDPATDRWTKLAPPFPAATYQEMAMSPYAGGVIDGKFYLMGGSENSGDGRMAVYDPATNQWTPKTPLALERPGAATAVQDAKLFVMGGRRLNAALDRLDTLSVTIVYDPVTDAWTRRASMPSPRAGISGIKVFLNGQPRIQVVGGTAPGNNLQYIP